VNPHLPQHQDEDKLGDQQRLDHRQRAVVQGKGLEDERADCGGNAQQPQWLTRQVQRQPPALDPPRRADARLVLRHQIDRVGQSGGQGKHHCQDHTAAPFASSPDCPGLACLPAGRKCAGLPPAPPAVMQSYLPAMVHGPAAKRSLPHPTGGDSCAGSRAPANRPGCPPRPAEAEVHAERWRCQPRILERESDDDLLSQLGAAAPHFEREA